MKKAGLVLFASIALLFTSLAQAAPIKRKICVFSIAGNVGPVMSMMKDWKVAALGWGLDAELVSYTSESIAAADLASGECDAALITGIRTRQFVRFSGTTDSIGAIQNLKQFRVVLKLLSSPIPQIVDQLNTEYYTILGIAPTGSAYFFVDDRSINTLDKAAGKKVAVLGFDKTQAKMVRMVGATPIDSDITNFSTKFNNGIVDIIGAPLAAYQALELYKGMTPDGGIIDYPLMMVTLQMVARKNRFPAEMAQKSRTYFYNHVDQALDFIKQSKKDIPDHWWVEIPKADKPGYQQLMQKARISLRDQGFYNGSMLTILRKVRCKFHPSRSECTNPVE